MLMATGETSGGLSSPSRYLWTQELVTAFIAMTEPSVGQLP